MKMRLIILSFAISFTCFSYKISESQIISACNANCISLCNGKDVKTWGDNTHGSLGDGTTVNIRNYPVVISSSDSILSVQAGVSSGMFHKNDSTLYTWGDNTYGQLGDGTNTDASIPQQVPGLTGVKKYSTVGWYTLCLKANGDLYAWGRNDYGQYGDGTLTASSVPKKITTLTNVKEVSAGGTHSLFLMNDSTVWACGRNAFGQLGDSTTIDKHTLVQMKGLSGIIAIAAGFDASIALKSDGTVWFCGYINYHTNYVLYPVKMATLSGIKAINASGSLKLALKNNGTVWAWGESEYCDGGGIGGHSSSHPTVNYVDIPTIIPALTGAVAIASSAHMTMIMKSDGSISTQGWNMFGQLGDSTNAFSACSPVKVVGSGNCNYINSVDEIFTTSNMFIFPNPANTFLMFSGNTIFNRVDLIDITGNILISEKVSTNTYQLNIQSLANGIYFTNVYSGSQIIKREKIIICK